MDFEAILLMDPGYCILSTKHIQIKHVVGSPILTHLSRMKYPISISRTSPFLILGMLDGIFHFYSNSNRTLYEQTVESLIRSGSMLFAYVPQKRC